MYNGYENYETWNICLWLVNDEDTYRETKRLRRLNSMTEKGGEFVVGPNEAYKIVLELFPEGTPDFDSTKDFNKVSWEEVAEAINNL